MTLALNSAPAAVSAPGQRPVYQPGDLVTTVTGYPVLYEVIRLESEGLVRVRGANWAQGYSAVVGLRDIRPVTHILSR